MDITAPNHILKYCYSIEGGQFKKIYSDFNDYYHRVYQIKCSCKCDGFRICIDDCPTVTAICSNCGACITLYDLDEYDASERPSWINWRTPSKYEYSYNSETLFNICVMYEYGEEYASNNDISWFTAWGYNNNIDSIVEIISDETT